MLRYLINKSDNITDEKLVDISSSEIYDAYGDSYSDTMVVKCWYTKETPSIEEGDTLSVVFNYSAQRDTYIPDYEYTYPMEVNVHGANTELRYFTFLLDKYSKLELSTMEYIDSEDSGEYDYVKFTFADDHYFRDDEDIRLYIKYYNAEDYGINGVLHCTRVSRKALLYKLKGGEEEDNLLGIIISSEADDGTITIDPSVGVYRENYLISEYSTFDVYTTRYLTDIKIPLIRTFDPTLSHNENIEEYYGVNDTNSLINSVVDYEKDIYYPVYKDETNNLIISTINFNVHFRKHENDDSWSVSDEASWNHYEYDGNTNDNVSDLLKFAGFSNDDVKYQKNKLKKTFLRLSFYDSPKYGSQNLLHTATIFLNGGKLYSTYVKYGHDNDGDNYFTVSDDYNIDNTRLVGNINVSRENVDFDEEQRLGMQFSIDNRYDSTNSSEGFYFYLWKDNYNGIEPVDVYAKIELNHAKYGRVIPLMFPYYSSDDSNSDDDNEGNIKTLSEIIDEWDEESDNYNPYNVNMFNDYSYIKMKYCYDRSLNKHIYYLDYNTYTNIESMMEGSNITLNLFEGRMK